MGTSKKSTHIIWAIVLSLSLLVACGKRGRNTKPVVKTNFLLDTLVKITAYGPGAEESVDEAFERIARVHKKMTAKADISEVIDINKAAGKESVVVDGETFKVIERGLYYSDLSQGKFDISIGPLVNLWGIGTDEARVPPLGEIEEAKALVNHKDVILDKQNNSVMLQRPHMGLDLGAIAKGYAADVAREALEKGGVEHAAIDLGGNMIVMGTKPDGSPWKIGLQDPFKPRGEVFALVEVIDRTIVTSGIYERYFTSKGQKYHHILDPKTGYPVENGLVSVTIITDKSMDADALSTVTFALGLTEGMELVESLPHVSAVFVTADKKVFISSEISSYNFRILDEEYELVL